MAKVLNPQTGKLEDAPDEQVSELVRSGRATFNDERVPVVSPDGELGTVPSGQARDALAQGYRLQSGEERQKYAQEKEFGGRPIAAGAAGLARGFTLGLSDLAAVESGLVHPRTLRGVKEANPAASIAGEVGGTAAGMLVGTGEVSAVKGVARAGALAEGLVAREAAEGLLRTAGRKALGQAVEGGLYGLGNVISETALGDPEMNAQKAVGMVGVAGLAGGALGGLFGAAGHGLGAALKAGKTAEPLMLPAVRGVEGEAAGLTGARVAPSSFLDAAEASAAKGGPLHGPELYPETQALSPIEARPHMLPAKSSGGSQELVRTTPAIAEKGDIAKADLETFADHVQTAAADMKGWEGGRKVFISDLHQVAAPDMPLADFKARLVEANRKRLVSLSRADLVEAMDPAKVAASEAQGLAGGATFHRLDRPGSGYFEEWKSAYVPKSKATPLPAEPLSIEELAPPAEPLSVEEFTPGRLRAAGDVAGQPALAASPELPAEPLSIREFQTSQPAQGLREQLKAFAERRAVKAIAGNGHRPAFRELEHKGITAAVGRFAMDEGILTHGATAEQMLSRAETSVEKHGERIGDIIKLADSKANPMVSGEELARRIEREVISPLRQGNAGDRAVANRLQQDADIVASKGEMSFAEADVHKRSFDKFLKHGAEQGPVQEGLKDIRRIIKQDINDKIDAIGQSIAPGLGEDFRAAKRSYGLASEIEDLAHERVLQLASNREFSLTDHAVAGMAMLSGGPGGVVAGIAGAVGNKLARERGPQALAIALDKLAESGAVSRISKAFAEQLGPRLEQLPELFGPFRSALSAAAARGADDLLATHIALSDSSPAYRNQMALAGYPEESPEDAHAAGLRSAHLDAVGAQLDAQDARTEAAVGRFLGQQGGAAPKEPVGHANRAERMKAFEERTRALQALTENPQAMAAALQVAPGLASHAPALATATMAAAANALRFLSEKAPRNPSPELLPALQRPWAPSDAELARWERYVAAVDNPQSVLAELRRGTLAPESVEALRAVYPKALEDIQQRMMNRVAGYQGQLTTQQRQALATLFGGQLGMSPTGNTAVYQQAHAVAAIQEAQKQQRARASSASKKSGSSSLATQSQRLEGR